MTTPNYDNFATQYDGQGASGAGAGAPPQQDPAMGGQMPDNSQGQFQGGAGGDPGSAGGQPQGTDAKTTLWYVPDRSQYYCPAIVSSRHEMDYAFTLFSILPSIGLPSYWASTAGKRQPYGIAD